MPLDTIRLKCPNGHRMAVGITLSGRSVKCADCAHVFRIPRFVTPAEEVDAIVREVRAEEEADARRVPARVVEPEILSPSRPHSPPVSQSVASGAGAGIGFAITIVHVAVWLVGAWLWFVATAWYMKTWGVLGVVANIALVPIFTPAFPFIFWGYEGFFPWPWVAVLVGLVVCERIAMYALGFLLLRTIRE